MASFIPIFVECRLIAALLQVYYSNKTRTIAAESVEGKCELLVSVRFEPSKRKAKGKGKSIQGEERQTNGEDAEGNIETSEMLATLDIFAGCGALSEGLQHLGEEEKKKSVGPDRPVHPGSSEHNKQSLSDNHPINQQFILIPGKFFRHRMQSDLGLSFINSSTPPSSSSLIFSVISFALLLNSSRSSPTTLLIASATFPAGTPHCSPSALHSKPQLPHHQPCVDGLVEAQRECYEGHPTRHPFTQGPPPTVGEEPSGGRVAQNGRLWCPFIHHHPLILHSIQEPRWQLSFHLTHSLFLFFPSFSRQPDHPYEALLAQLQAQSNLCDLLPGHEVLATERYENH
ncbi:hypothetical protein EJ110_NYTH04949 [Nymphaea thermarum]|nr:hypothetical protein EJ110_NYTH04949 [Nymphaea thermarum]